MNWIGFNCSLPHKVAAHRVARRTCRVGAAHRSRELRVRSNGRWIGENTDGQGFLASLRTVADPAGQRAHSGAGGRSRHRRRARAGRRGRTLGWQTETLRRRPTLRIW